MPYYESENSNCRRLKTSAGGCELKWLSKTRQDAFQLDPVRQRTSPTTPNSFRPSHHQIADFRVNVYCLSFYSASQTGIHSAATAWRPSRHTRRTTRCYAFTATCSTRPRSSILDYKIQRTRKVLWNTSSTTRAGRIRESQFHNSNALSLSQKLPYFFGLAATPTTDEPWNTNRTTLEYLLSEGTRIN